MTVIVIRLFITRLALYGRGTICHSLINQITDGFDQTLRYLNSATQTELQSHSSAYWNFLYVFFLQKMLNAENILQQHQSENELSTIKVLNKANVPDLIDVLFQSGDTFSLQMRWERSSEVVKVKLNLVG